MAELSTASVNIEADIAAVQNVLFDLANYPSWSTAIKSVEVLQKDAQGRATQIKMKVESGALKDKPTLNYDWSKAPERLEFSLEDADLLTEMSGAYVIKDNGDGTTNVTYELGVALSMPVPAIMRQKAEKSTIDLALKQLKEKLEN
ncbi:MAG: polyketide cyclase / dehydrase and lipid transport [Actinobacteria bacterium]|nr:polyketide cyclase / dehydrase and lipid transport [Actinomycetota bacterium]